jgi:hypothetical protein
MITAATIAITIERPRDRCLPGRETVECADVWSALTRLPDVGKSHRTERRAVRDQRRRRAVVRLPGRGW